ncbi:Compactin diketide synthase mokB [Penicillium rolfsii]|nr:Compactin diketide synthase mokB [Penicillium rolfsii]
MSTLNMSRSCCRDHHVRSDGHDALAIVGMAMRLPGGVRSDEALWDFLINKKSGHCGVPSSRYNVDAFYHPTKSGHVRTRHGYFLEEDPTFFDNAFFSITAIEAARLDPQQRLLLEVIWECMESCGQVGWRGSKIGCFVGVFGEDWLDINSKDTERIDRYHVLGTGYFALSNRISYEFDLTGPSMTLETGCSSSLVGLHEACNAILAGDCPSAIVAGTNLILSPTMTTTMSDNMVLSPSGVCRTFDAKADGYGRAEGINALYIKRVSDAIRDGDPIRAIIRSTASNCDGKTPGITTPGSVTQKALVQKAYERAMISDITETGFFECHGTGTVIGDTAETSVVADLFSKTGVVIGSIKPNLGHSEGASGITSVIKTVLALERKLIPPNIFFESPNPKIPFKESQLVVPVDPLPWPAGRKYRASVNCFGIGGANAHIILESPASVTKTLNLPEYTQPSQGKKLLVVSASCGEALSQKVKELKHYAASRIDPLLNNIAYTLGERREHLKHRAFAITSSVNDLDFSAGVSTETSIAPRLMLVFTGQGAQWAGVARDLFAVSPGFKQDIRTMDKILRSVNVIPSWSIESILTNPDLENRINEPIIAQPVCTAIQIGLFNILQRYGITPSAVVGHSSGEIAAAYAAGAITAASAILLAYYRGQCLEGAQSGAMAAVGLGCTEMEPWLRDGVTLACDNSPSSSTISGNPADVDHVLEQLSAAYPDVFHRKLKVDKAYHSEHMRPIAGDYQSVIESYIESLPNMLPLYSTVTGTAINDSRDLGSAYWSRNLVSRVNFRSAIQAVLKDYPNGEIIFIEAGPHSALQGPLRQIFDSAERKDKSWYIPTLIRGDSAEESILKAAGNLFARGVKINFHEINGPGVTLTNLTNYPWQHTTKLLNESRLSQQWRFRQFPHHELLGSRVVESSDLEPMWRNVLQVQNCAWLCHHNLFKDTVFPCAGYIAMVGEAIRQHCQAEAYELRNLVLKKPLFLPELTQVEVLTSLKPGRLSDVAESDWFDFTILAMEGTEWQKYCQGQARAAPARDCSSVTEQQPWTRGVDPVTWYHHLSRLGLNYGRSFQRLRNITVDPLKHCATASVVLEASDHDSHYMVHPTIIDQSLQLLSVAVTNGLARKMSKLVIPASIGHVYVTKVTDNMWLQAYSNSKGASTSMTGHTAILSNGIPALVIQDATFFAISDRDLAAEDSIPLLSQLEWTEHLDMIPPVEKLTFEPKDHGISLQEKLAHLYILELAERVANLKPKTEELRKYQSWVLCTGSQILVGTDKELFGKPWGELSTNERKFLAQTLRQDLEKYGQLAVNTEKVLRAVYENCCSIIEGHVQALEVLTMDLLRDFYDYCTSLSDWTSFFTLVRHWNPRVRILEVGAGTGATCARVIELLKSKDGVATCFRYMYTDISSAFFSAAAARFKDCEYIEYKTFDITKDPLAQGFTTGTFDIILASNASHSVLHSTPCLLQSLLNLRSLLVPGGYLLLQELCPDVLAVDLVMGILPDWWKGADDNRHDKPYVSSSRWNEELLRAGFTGAESITLDNVYPLQINANIISRVPWSSKNKCPVTFLVSDTVTPWELELEATFLKHGYQTTRATLTTLRDDAQCIISLLDLHDSVLYQTDEETFSKIQNLLMRSSKTPIIWVTPSVQSCCEDPRFGLILGLARTLRREIVGDIVTIEVEALNCASLKRVFDIYEYSRRNLPEGALHDTEYLIRDGKVYTSRFHWRSLAGQIEYTPDHNLPRQLSVGTYGLLDTLHWRPAGKNMPSALARADVEVDIHYVGLNFKDIMVSLGVLGEEDELGIEASGIVRKVGVDAKDLQVGDHVVLFGINLFRSPVQVNCNQCMKIPDDLSLSDAASMPAVYGTAMYSLIQVGQLQKQQSVLIHCAAGGVGIASIQICKAIGATIYATAGSTEKRSHLHREWGIPYENIFNSRDDTFVKGVMRRTDGAGVDLVLNSLAGSLLHASWQCVGEFGKMIELGKRDFLAHATLDMAPFNGNRSFIGVDMSALSERRPWFMRSLMTDFFQWYEEGKILPVRPVTVFPAEDVSDAFRYMHSGKHMGKIVVEVPSELTPAFTRPIKRSVAISENKSYLLVGGLGGIGRAVANWLVERGARHLIMLSRSAGQLPEHVKFSQELRRQDCLVDMVAGDVGCPQDVTLALSKDESFAKMSYSQWLGVMRTKVDGTWNLHQALTKHEQNLEFFVLFSSMAGLVGTVGQANYAAANSFMDAFVQYRRQQGLVASVLNLGVVEDIGCVSREPALLGRVKFTAGRLIQERTVIEALHVALCQSRPAAQEDGGPNDSQPTSNVMAIGVNSTKPLSAPGVTPLWGAHDIRFSMYENLEGKRTTATDTEDDNLKDFFHAIQHNPELLEDPETERRIMKELCTLIAAHMSVEGSSDEEMADTPIDSLMAIEIRNWFRRKLAIEVTLTEISKAGTVGGLSKVTIATLRARSAPQAPAAEASA